MYGPFGSLLPLAGFGALFGRRRGGDRHGEIPQLPDSAQPLPDDATFDALDVFEVFEAFADVAAEPPEPSEPSDLEESDPVPPVGAPSRPEAPPTSEVPEPPLGASIDEAVDGWIEHPVEPARLAGETPAWVLGEESLDGPGHPDGARPEVNPRFPEELWHPVPDEFEPVVGSAAVAPTLGDEGSDAVAIPVEVSASELAPAFDLPVPAAEAADDAPFALNRLRRVCGPPDGGPGGSEVRQATTSTIDRDVEPVRPAGGGLIVGPVGRSRTLAAPNRRRGRHSTATLGRSSATPTASADDASESAVVPAAPEVHEPRREIDGEPGRPVPVLVAADGSVKTGTGSVRVARPEDASASSGPDGLVVSLLDHWCWAALDEFGPVLVVRAGATELRVPAGTTALLSIDEDGSQLAVVLEGEGVVSRDGARVRLRRGAMVFLPVDGEPQVDVAPDDEIRADPLVARNLELDGLS